jgi:hypothetical protein
MVVSLGGRIKRSAIVVHRWLGVALCAIFLLWFPSGIGDDALGLPERQPRRSVGAIAGARRFDDSLSPMEAYNQVGAPQPTPQVRLGVFDGRPVYRFRAGRGEYIVYADTGEEQLEVSHELVRRAATAWTGPLASAAQVESIEDGISGRCRSRSAGRCGCGGTRGRTASRCTSRTGPARSCSTRRARRGWARMSVPHCLYFTPLRRHGRSGQRPAVAHRLAEMHPI